MTRDQEHSEQAVRGFSLLEVLISILFLTVVAVTVLQCFTYCLQVSGQAEKHWRDSLSKWNQTQGLRCLHGGAGNLVIVLPEARPMYYAEVLAENETPGRQWGVLLGAK